MNRDPRVSSIDSLVRAALSASRYAHSRETAFLARELCGRFGLDEQKGYIAGLAHDLARETEPAELLRLCDADGLGISATERAEPILLHGRAAAALLSRRAGYSDPEVLQAIRDHVTGRPSMGALARVLFAADFLEPTRDFLTPAFRERTLSLGFDAMVLAVLDRKIQYVRAEAKTIVEASQTLLEELTGHVG